MAAGEFTWRTSGSRRGLEIRREVLGNEYVDSNLASSDEFMMTFQRIVTELAWGMHGTALRSTRKQNQCSALPSWLRADVSKRSKSTREAPCALASRWMN